MVEYEYDARGNHKVLNGNGVEITDSTHIGNKNVLRYRGYIYDAVSGLYYLNARFYDPETGRFISMDDISYVDVSTYNGLNLYMYCRNSPVMYVDYDGKKAILVTAWGNYGLPVFGHSALYINFKDKNGCEVWYLTEFTGDKKADAKTLTQSVFGDPYEHIKNRYSGTKISWLDIPLFRDYKAIEIDITFSSDILTKISEKSGKYNEKYDLLGNNCVDFSQDVLSEGSECSNAMVDYPAIIPALYGVYVELYQTNITFQKVIDGLVTGYKRLKHFFGELFR